MEPFETHALARIAEHRFRNFSEAADVVLEVVSSLVPGVITLARLESDYHSQQVIEVRGDGLDGLERGVLIPTVGDGIDTDFLRSASARSWVSTNLEMGDGRTVGVLFAADPRDDAYRDDHAAVVAMAARLLSYEWESVELRAEARRLRRQVHAGPQYDPDTGLANREAFIEQLGREWRLAKREVLPSVLLACRVGQAAEDAAGASEAKRALGVRVAAEVLEATVRETDLVGRLDEQTLGAVLVGCRPDDTPSFVARYLSALERVTSEQDVEARVACGVQPLADAASPAEALASAQSSIEESSGDSAGPSAVLR